MPIFAVHVPAADFQVEAENDACAIDKALDQDPLHPEPDRGPDPDRAEARPLAL